MVIDCEETKVQTNQVEEEKGELSDKFALKIKFTIPNSSTAVPQPHEAEKPQTECFIQPSEKSLVKKTKNMSFNSIEELSSFLLPTLNSGFYLEQSSETPSVFDVRKTTKYVKLKCEVCGKFEYWYEEKEGKIKFNRIINQQHIKHAHEKIIPRDPQILQGCKPVQMKTPKKKI